MEERRSKILCWNCREKVQYEIRTRKEVRQIKGQEYEFPVRYAVCAQCGEEITVPGLDDENEREADACYRKRNGLITIEQIEMILEKYHIDKRPLSKMLGFGELTITRYLEGQLPSKRYSDILLQLLQDDEQMKEKLENGRQSITDAAYRKVKEAIAYREKMLSHNTKIEAVALYLLSSSYEITNLSLQKLLYYVKAFGYLFLERDILDADCEAWVHGPVFPIIYNKYREYGKSIIPNEDVPADVGKFLPQEEIALINFVLGCFGIYNGMILREFTHQEQPWIKARGELGDTQRCNNVMWDKDIQEYFQQMDEVYNLHERAGVEQYIRSLRVI